MLLEARVVGGRDTGERRMDWRVGIRDGCVWGWIVKVFWVVCLRRILKVIELRDGISASIEISDFILAVFVLS